MYSVIDASPSITLTSFERTQTIANPLPLLQMEQLQRMISSNPFDRKTSNCTDPQWQDALTVVFFQS